jgi:hypothetical protein
MAFESDSNVTIFIRGDNSDFKAKAAEVQKLITGLGKAGVSSGRNLSSPYKEVTETLKKTAKAAAETKTGMNGLGKEAANAADGFSKAQANIVTFDSALSAATKVARIAGRTFEFMVQTLDEASKVEGLAKAFDNFQGGVGTATASIQRLRGATKGLISDFDLFQASNNATILGVVDGTGKINTLAAAAVTLGRAVGRSATDAFNDLAFGIGRESRLILDNLGIVVKAGQVYKDYADSIGVAVDALTTLDRKTAFTEAAMKAVAEAVADLGGIQETAAVAAERLAATSENLSNAFSVAVSDSTLLTGSLNVLNEVLLDSEDNVTALGQSLGNITGALTGAFGLALAAANGILDEFLDNFRRIGIVVANFQDLNFDTSKVDQQLRDLKESLNIDEAANTFTQATRKLEKGFEIFDASFKLTEGNVVQVRNAFSQLAAAVAKLDDPGARQALVRYRDRLAELTNEFDKNRSSVSRSSDANKKFKSSVDSVANAVGKLASVALPDENPFVDQILEVIAQSDAAGDSVRQLTADLEAFARSASRSPADVKLIQGAVPIAKGRLREQEKFTNANDNLINSLQNLGSETTSFEGQLTNLEERYRFGALDLDQYKEGILSLQTAAGKDANKLDALDKSLTDISQITAERGSILTSIGDSDFLGLGDFAKGLGDINFETGGAIDALGVSFAGIAADSLDVLQSELSSQDKFRAIASAVGVALGAAIGGILGGPGGAAAGAAIGQLAGDVAGDIGNSLGDTVDAIGKLLLPLFFFPLEAVGVDFSKLAGDLFGLTAGEGRIARQGIQDFFKNIARELEFQGRVFGEGQIFETSSLFTTGFNVEAVNELGEEITNVQFLLDGLNIPDDLVSEFNNLGVAFETIFEVADLGGDIVGQLTQLLQGTIQNPLGLNELQILLEASGFSAEKFGQVLEEAFLKGDVGARDFLGSTSAINNLFEQGIPGVDGIEAVGLAFQNLTERGSFSGRELIDSIGDIGAEAEDAGIPFEELGAQMIAAGQDAGQVSILMQTLADQGISTFEQLRNISPLDAAALFTGLEDAGFQFVDVTEKGRDFAATLKEGEENLDRLQRTAQDGVDLEYRINVVVDRSELDGLEASTGSTGDVELPTV